MICVLEQFVSVGYACVYERDRKREREGKRMKEREREGEETDQPSISSTLNARILCTNVLLYVRQSQNVTRKSCAKHFCMKNLRF